MMYYSPHLLYSLLGGHLWRPVLAAICIRIQVQAIVSNSQLAVDFGLTITPRPVD
jgi:hypothetical protein